MKLLVADFNRADTLCQTTFASEWAEVESVLATMPLHLHASDQKGKQGNPIFDPKGTNGYIKTSLNAKGWATNITIPEEWSFLGTDIDFSKNGVIVEAQFSNYPFLLNNVIRSELFVQSKTPLPSSKTHLVILITKAHMFPASNSTLYYEQANNQLQALAKNNVFNAPVRLVGLSEDVGKVSCIFTKYHKPRYSRTVTKRRSTQCDITKGARKTSRCKIVVR